MADTRSIVPAPDRAPSAFGLFSVLSFRDTGRWLTGVTWPGSTCGPASVYEVACTDGSEEIVRPERMLGWGTADAVSVEGTFSCTPVGITLAEIEERAVEDLQRHEEAAVEEHLWGLLAADTDVEVVTGLDASPKGVLGALERHAARSYGSKGVLHLPRQLAPFFEGLLEVRGGQLHTFLGTPVAAGAGYGEADGSTVYISPSVLAYRGEAQMLGTPEQLFDRSNNLLTAVAQRDYLVGYDTCPIASATVTL